MKKHDKTPSDDLLNAGTFPAFFMVLMLIALPMAGVSEPKQGCFVIGINLNLSYAKH